MSFMVYLWDFATIMAAKKKYDKQNSKKDLTFKLISEMMQPKHLSLSSLIKVGIQK